MNVLLTGINGFIGRNLAYHLLRQGYDVIGIDISKNCIVNDISEYYSGTILDNTLISKANNLEASLLTTEKDYLRINKNYINKISFLKIKSEIDNKKDFIKDIKNFI